MSLGGRWRAAAAVLLACCVGCGADLPDSAQASSAMVQLRSEACRRLSTSSGVAVTHDIVVTAAHNVAGAAEVDVIGPAGTWTGVAVLVDTDLDVAFVRVEGANLTPAPLADRVGLRPVYETAAERFPAIRATLNRLSDRVFFPEVQTADRGWRELARGG